MKLTQRRGQNGLDHFSHSHFVCLFRTALKVDERIEVREFEACVEDEGMDETRTVGTMESLFLMFGLVFLIK